MQYNVSRRGFLAGATAAAAAAALGAPGRAPANDRIGLAIIGCRNRGHQLADLFERTGQYDLVAMSDCDTAMFDRAMASLEGKLSRAPRFEQDFRRVLEDPAVDAVAIATPDHWHACMTNLALAAGKHVFLEKPASYNIADGQAMVAMQRKHPQLTVLVGTQQRSGPHFAGAKAFVQEGGLGKVGFCRAWIAHDRGRLETLPDTGPPPTLDYGLWLGPAPERPYNENRVHYVWRFIRDYGTGEMGNWGAHWIDTILWFLDLGLPLSTSGYGGQFVVKDAKEWPDTQTVLYEYPELTLLWEQRIWTRYPVNGRGGGAELSGDKGALQITRGGWTFYPHDGEPVAHPGSVQDLPHAAHFAECIRDGASPVADMEAGHISAALCHLGNIAVALNRRIQFDSASGSFPDAGAEALRGREARAPWEVAV